MRLAGHSSVTVSQRYVHPPRAMEDAVARLDNMNARSLESVSMDSSQRVLSESTDQRAEVLAGTDTRTDTALPSLSVSH